MEQTLELTAPPNTKRKGPARHSQVTFKPYQQGQSFLLPPSLDDLLSPNHVVRVVSRIIDQINIEPLLAAYKGGGTSSYHPRMMLKVMVYAYTQKRFSSRQIAKALRENIPFMWLSGNSRPDFRTINHFRSSRLKGVIDAIFAEVIEYLHQEGYIHFDNYFVDGSKFEADANKHSHVWRKSVARYKEQLREKIRALLAHIDGITETENQQYGDRDLEELGEDVTLDSQRLAKTIARLNEKLKQQPENKELKKSIKKLKKDALPRLERYEQQEQTLAGRNSYSKTDSDATFMRLKGERLGQGRLRAAYNIQIGTENQFVVNASVHQNASDTVCFTEHMDKFESLHEHLPQNVIGDAAYGSEENYDYLDQKGANNFLKYNTFHFEQTKKFKENAFHVQNLPYDADRDEYTCPAGKVLRYEQTIEVETATGYRIQKRVYKAEDCQGCELKTLCHKGQGPRQIHVGVKLKHFKERARENLNSEQGRKLRSKRGVDVEPAFGNIKHNLGFRRFRLRGLKKVNIEINLVSMAHNMIKLAA